MTALEGLLDTSAARRHPGHVTGALARATAARALGAAAGTGLLPLLVVGVGLEATVATVSLILLAAGLVATFWLRGRVPGADTLETGAPMGAAIPVPTQVG